MRVYNTYRCIVSTDLQQLLHPRDGVRSSPAAHTLCISDEDSIRREFAGDVTMHESNITPAVE